MNGSRIKAWGYAALLLLVALWHLANVYLPYRATPVETSLGQEWIAADGNVLNGYFRRSVHLPMEPNRAWIAIAADEYSLYVNGELIGENIHLLSPSMAFLNRLTSAEQSTTKGRVVSMSRAPEERKIANQEWRVAQLYEIGHLLKKGENTIALKVQSDHAACFGFNGRVVGAHESVELGNRPGEWLYSPVSTPEYRYKWYDNAFPTRDWRPAGIIPAPPKPVYSVLPPSAFCEPFGAQAFTVADTLADELFFRAPLGDLLSGESGWLRIRCDRPYDLYLAGDLVASGNGRGVDVFDVTAFLPEKPDYAFLRLNNLGGGQGMPLTIAGETGAASLSWEALNAFNAQWLNGAGEWTACPASDLLRTPSPFRYYLPVRPVDLFSWQLLRLAGKVLLGMAALFLCCGLVPGQRPLWSAMKAAERFRQITLPSLLLVFCLEMMRYRFLESDYSLFFFEPATLAAMPGFLPGSLLIGILLCAFREGRINVRQAMTAQWPVYLALAAIILLGTLLRIWNLGFEDLQADENVSWDAARGVLKTGVPQAVSGVLYTRSPLYHYMLAGWLGLFGDTMISARLSSMVPGVLLIGLAFVVARRLSGKAYIGLLVALLVATDPWLISISGIIRFYQQLQFFALLATWYFLRGFVWKEGLKPQMLFFLTATAGVLSQEVFVTLLPAFAIGGVCFYKPFSFAKDKYVVIAFITMMFITILDILTFSLVCLTPHVGVASTSGSIMTLNFNDITSFATTFFFGNNRAHLLYTVLALLGVPLWLRENRKDMLLLYLIVVLTVITLTLLVLQVAGRYTCSIYPMLIVLAICSTDAVARRVIESFYPAPLRRRLLALVAALAVVVLIINLEPNKIYLAYNRTRNMRHQTSLDLIAQLKQPGDKIMSVHPMPAAILFGGIDYYLLGEMAFDELYQTPGAIVERWAGGHLVSKPDQFDQLFQKEPRIWIVLDNLEMGRLSQEVIDYLADCCTVQFEFFGGKVLLWDRSAGRYRQLPRVGADADTY